MTARWGLSPRAQDDLRTIWNYTARNWNPDQADRYVRQITRDIETVAALPTIGRSCSEVRPGYFRYPSGSHLIFYRAVASGIAVVRILHARMDADRHL